MSPPPAQPVLVRIRGVAKGGAGIGHEDPAPEPDGAQADSESDAGEARGRTWFVEGALPGELVEAVAYKAKRSFVRGETVRVVEASASRVEAPCALAARCGGCDWQHVRVSDQAALKNEIVQGQLRRLEPKMDQPVPSPKAQGYRRRARLHYRKVGGELVLGFNRRSSHEIEDMHSCPVLHPVLDAAIQRLRAIAGALLPAGEVHALTDGQRVVLGLPGIRPDKAPVQAFKDLVGEGEPTEGLVGIVLRGARKRLTIGRAELSIDGGDGQAPLRIGPFTFAQAQSEQNEALVAHVARVAKAGGKEVLELYAGAGNFTRRLGREALRVRAIDDARESIGALRRMAQQLSLPVDAKATNIDKLLPTLLGGAPNVDVVVLDPPRGGVGKKGAAIVARLARERIVYVSCDPATLNRDLEAMLAARPQLKLRGVRVFDMMPMTSECETVAWLEVGK